MKIYMNKIIIFFKKDFKFALDIRGVDKVASIHLKAGGTNALLVRLVLFLLF